MKPCTEINILHILWIRTDSIGDNVLAASMLEPIANKFQSARITVLCQDHIAELYAPCPFVSHIVTFNKTLAYTDAHYREVIIRRIAALNADITMNSVYSRELIGDIFATRSGAALRVGFLGDLCNIDETLRCSNNCYYTALLPSTSRYKPEIERHADFLRYFGIEAKSLHHKEADSLHPTVWTTPEDERFAEQFFDRNQLHTAHTLAVAPGSQNDYKIYPLFSEVLKGFTNFKLIILGGIDTVAVSGEIYEKFNGTSYNLTGKATLRQTAAIIRRCRLVLSSDSAAAHIATAVGTPNVVVLGGGHFGRFFPYSRLTTAVCLPLECYRCDWRCRYEEKFCITAITPELIAWAVETSLATPAEKPRLIAQGSPLCTRPLPPHWHSAEYFLEAGQADIESISEIPQTFPCCPPAINDNKAVSDIVDKLKQSPSQEETLALYESYLRHIPYDLNAVQTLNTLRHDILRQQLPKISIVTPSYNQGAYLEECILSIITQGYPNLEYIIMDGGSSDNSVEIIKKYERYITYSKSAPDAGQYAAIDEGLRRSTGQIMGWLNSDDKLHAGALWVVSMVFSAFSEVQWLMGRPTVWDAGGTLSVVLEPIPVWSKKQYLDGFIGPPHIQQESTFWSRKLWEAAGGYIDTSLRYAGDMELWARFFRTADLYSVYALIGGIRNHPEQKTAKPASDGSGYYDYGDYNSEADVIIKRELGLYNQSPEPLRPPHAPLCPAEAARRLNNSIWDSILPENFSCFTYSKRYHSAYFNNTLPNSIDSYRYNLASAFAAANLPEGSKILFADEGITNSTLFPLASKYELWVLADTINTEPPVGVVYYVDSRTTKFTSELPSNYFDLAVTAMPNEQACNQIELLIKTGGYALFFFDAAINSGTVSVGGTLPYVLSKPHAIAPYVDTSCMQLDPGALYFKDDTGRQTLSYNVLWKKTPCEPNQPAKPETASNNSFKHHHMRQSASPEIEEIHAALQNKWQKNYMDSLRQKLASSPHTPLYIWGTGRGGHQTYDILRALNATVTGFIDSNSLKWHTKFRGLDVISPEEIYSKFNINMIAEIRPFIVVSSQYDSEIRPILEGWGYVSRENYWTNIFRFKHI
ncbi:glycosyltransferase [Candidatus Magnetominusculus xianensis]|uniref:Glycosyl transferase family 2 n=1 Tax=Candidatus Magnetominusculus xianensis TaxID=1748249 RepID=A0ABR5SHH8_9BACT|nr:glycosyltransferase [Candidatus Magnetominusculus xianensis]KWT87083.1 glycosyl transferase family 2 [Candidatus Magnetominusculus xianensis]MBF0404992.1 glycosyltransferase [Nitrospirota bacterium]